MLYNYFLYPWSSKSVQVFLIPIGATVAPETLQRERNVSLREHGTNIRTLLSGA
jgi:hypothetical protein